MTRLLAVLLALGVPGAAVAACGEEPTRCTQADCRDSVRVTARIPVSPEALARAPIELCLNGRCAVGELPAPVDGGQPLSFGLSGAGLDATGALHEGGPGQSEIGLAFVAMEPALRDGDRYRLAISDRSGARLLDVERFTTYTTLYPNGAICGPTCRTASMNFAPTSASGLTCTAVACRSGAVIQQRLVAEPGSDVAEVVICRNDHCFTSGMRTHGEGGGSAFLFAPLQGELRYRLDANAVDVTIFVDAPNDVLADGDRYRVTFTDSRSKKQLARIDRTVTYEDTFPNGRECDVDACKVVRIEGP